MVTPTTVAREVMDPAPVRRGLRRWIGDHLILFIGIVVVLIGLWGAGRRRSKGGCVVTASGGQASLITP